MRLIRNIKYVSPDGELVFFIKDRESVPNEASGWISSDVYLDRLTLNQVMNRRVADELFIYGHKRLQMFVISRGPEVSFDDYTCMGKGSFLFMKNWESFRRFLRQGK